MKVPSLISWVNQGRSRAQLARLVVDPHIIDKPVTPCGVSPSSRVASLDSFTLFDRKRRGTRRDVLVSSSLFLRQSSTTIPTVCMPVLSTTRGHDTRVDLWSLGCVVFEALVGEHPFQRRGGRRTDRQALFERIQRGRPDYPSCLSVSCAAMPCHASPTGPLHPPHPVPGLEGMAGGCCRHFASHVRCFYSFPDCATFVRLP